MNHWHHLTVYFGSKMVGDMALAHEYNPFFGEGRIILNLDVCNKKDKEIIMKRLYTDFMDALKKRGFVLKRYGNV